MPQADLGVLVFVFSGGLGCPASKIEEDLVAIQGAHVQLRVPKIHALRVCARVVGTTTAGNLPPLSDYIHPWTPAEHGARRSALPHAVDPQLQTAMPRH